MYVPSVALQVHVLTLKIIAKRLSVRQVFLQCRLESESASINFVYV